MTGLYDRTPGQGHNQPPHDHDHENEEIWERWAKKRVFVRQLEGTYSHLYQALVEQPRVFSFRDLPWKGGPHSSANMSSVRKLRPSPNRSRPISKSMRRALMDRNTAT